MMTKHFPTALMSAAWLLFAASSSRRLATAYTDQENNVISILEDMEKEAMDLRDILEEVYKQRCEPQTHSSCIRSNYNDCSSAFPGQKCTFRKPQCGNSPTRCDGEGGCNSDVSELMRPDSEVPTQDCNVLFDETITKVSIPNSVTESSQETKAKIIESACYSRLAEEYMISRYELSRDIMAKYGTQPHSFYFGGHDGLFRQVPALHQVQCGCFDPRRRPWFVAASSGPKNVVLVIDVSGSMDDNKSSGRMRMTKKAAVTVVDTLTAADAFAVISFSTEASQLGGTDLLLVANNANKDLLKEQINELKPDGATNFWAAFTTAFDAIDKSLENENEGTLTTGPIAILFMTDGKIAENMDNDGREVETKKVIDLVNERTEQLSEKSRDVTIFTYSLGGESEQDVTKNLSCSTGGIWAHVEDCGNLVGKMSSYYKLLALGNQNAIAWVDTYKFIFRGVMGTTVSVPVYDRNVTPPIFLGVAAVDIYLSPIQQILGLDEEEAIVWLNEWTKTRNYGNLASYKPLTGCQLDALRYLGSGPEATCEVCNRTDYAGIVPEPCELFEHASLYELWGDNIDLEGKDSYEDRATCPGPDPTPEPSPPSPPSTAIIAGTTVGCFAAVAVCACIFFQKKNSKPPPLKRRTIRSTTLEESATQAPVAVEVTGHASPANRFLAALVSSSAEDDGEAAALSVLRDHGPGGDGSFDPRAPLNGSGMNALHFSAGRCAISVLRELLSDNCRMDVNSQDGDGNTALHHASSSSCESSSLEAVRILVEEYGADVLRRNGAGSTPYDAAEVQGRQHDAASTQAVRGYLRMKVREAEDELIRRTFEILDRDHAERMLVARSHRFLAAVSSSSAEDDGEAAALSVLRDHGPGGDGSFDPRAPLNDSGMNALHVSAGRCAISVLRELLSNDYGMDVNSPDGDGNTALHHASSSPPNNERDGGESSSLDAVRILVEEFGADVLRRNGAGSTPYDAASTQAVRDYLCMTVVVPVAVESENAAVRFLAAVSSSSAEDDGEAAALSVLRDHGPGGDGSFDPRAPLNDSGMNALHVSAGRCAISVLRELLSDNCRMDVNSQDGYGNTALHHASSSSPNNGRDGGELSSLDVVKILVDEYGADVLRRNGAGSASYDAASTQAVRDYLRKVAIRIAFEIVDQDHEGRVLAARLEHMPR